MTVPVTSIDVVDTKTSAPRVKRKIICFSDFDGTIFMQDTGHILFDHHGCGTKRREVLDEQIKSGERSFRDVSEEMWGSLRVSFDDGFEVMKTKLEIDPEFRRFHKFCMDNDIPFNVISAGLKPILRRVLDTFLGEQESAHIDIVANDAQITADGSEWKPIWKHDCELGHDKAASITEYRSIASSGSGDGTVPLIVFIGDGVSDLPAAREADVLFARKGLKLEDYCLEHKIPYYAFETFADIQREVVRIMKEDQDRTGGMGKPAAYNPRANLWRRVSGNKSVNPLSSRSFPLPLDHDTLSVLRDAIVSATASASGMQGDPTCIYPPPIVTGNEASLKGPFLLGSPLAMIGFPNVFPIDNPNGVTKL